MDLLERAKELRSLLVEKGGQMAPVAAAAAVGVTTVVVFKIWRRRRMAALRKKWDNVGKDVVVVHHMGRARYVPSPSPYPIKLETFLRMEKIDYVHDNGVPMSPDKKKMPWITVNGVDVADSQLSIEYLRKNWEEPAQERAVRIMMEDHYYWVGALDRWVYNKARECPAIFAPSGLPGFVERFVYTHVGGAMVKKQAWAAGMGRHTRAEVAEMGKKDLKAVSTLLGDRDFFGESGEPSVVDCTVFGFLALFLYQNPTNKDDERKRFIETNCENLVRHTERMKERFWPDWEDARWKP